MGQLNFIKIQLNVGKLNEFQDNNFVQRRLKRYICQRFSYKTYNSYF